MRHSRIVLFLVATLCIAGSAYAQPQWRFHLAFEDATGARDTLWFIWDTTATIGWFDYPEVDYDLGEAAVEMDLEAFNVWMWNWDLDSTKTLAYPYTWFPLHGQQGIYGFNYEYPITIRWDRSLFQAGYLPDPDAINTALFTYSDYFYWHGNEPFLGAHSILFEDSVVVGMEALLTPLFPMMLYISHQSGTGIEEVNVDQLVRLTISEQQLQVTMGNAMEHLSVYSTSGQIIFDSALQTTQTALDITDWPAGLYIVRIRTSTNTWHHGKFIKGSH